MGNVGLISIFTAQALSVPWTKKKKKNDIMFERHERTPLNLTTDALRMRKINSEIDFISEQNRTCKPNYLQM